ncbi:putative glutathione S-transferase BZ2 [Dichanthelium oligosanthes]|uniref:Putative glutathione S-transferase BZ2 n=1 Tax=Dichanthelium oligosanthes TaxID=888268 RepID=A0A1E5V5H7_9POAL|nr:putative glutathione S-transferase BZ2 [Dichanthelium oligosanthes]
MHRFWTVFIDDKFWPALDAVSLGPTPDTRSQAADDTRAALQLLEEAFKDRSNGAAFFSSRDAAPGLLNLALGCFLPVLRACECVHGLSLIDASATPRLGGGSHRFAAHPATSRVLPGTDKVVQFTRFLQAKFGVDVSK